VNSFFPLLRRLLLACSIPAAIVAAPIAAQAAEGTGKALTATDLMIETGGIASDDQSLSWSETVEEAVLQSEQDSLPMLYEVGEGTSRFAVTAVTSVREEPSAFRPSGTPIAQLGPFYLVAPDTIEMIGTVDSDSPYQLARMMATHPGVRRLVMVECPGSVDEAANHMLARQVRQAGLETHVPRGGSIRSGAVDLFLAGIRRTADPSAEFGVHSWRDEDGMQADDFAANDPVNLEYIDYYREMGLSDRTARQFYALTNSVPFESVRTLSAADMARLGLAEISG
jgi:hypothetical protein